MMDPEKLAKLLLKPNYAHRIIDDFEGFDRKEFDKRYAERNYDVLRNSLMTNALHLVYDFGQRYVSRSQNSPFWFKPVVHVNIHPYKVDQGFKDTLREIVRKKLPIMEDVEIVSFSHEELTPMVIKHRYKSVVMYDFNDWYEKALEAKLIQETPLPDVTFFAPALLKHVDKDLPKDVSEIFTEIMKMNQIFVNLYYLPVDTFSTVMAVKIPESAFSGEPGILSKDDLKPNLDEIIDPYS